MLKTNNVMITPQDRANICQQLKTLSLCSIASALSLILVFIVPIGGIVGVCDKIIMLITAITLLKMSSIVKNYQSAATCYFIVSLTLLVDSFIGLGSFGSMASYLIPIAAFNELMGHYAITLQKDERIAQRWRVLAWVEVVFTFASTLCSILPLLATEINYEIFFIILVLIVAIVSIIFKLIRIVYYKQTIRLFQDN